MQILFSKFHKLQFAVICVNGINKRLVHINADEINLSNVRILRKLGRDSVRKVTLIYILFLDNEEKPSTQPDDKRQIWRCQRHILP